MICTIDEGMDQVDVALEKPIAADGAFDRYAVELWLGWLGPASLALSALPRPY